MSRQINNKEKSKPIFITSIVLGVLAAFVLLLSIVQKDASFLVSLIGLVGLILLMNIAQRLNINKEKQKGTFNEDRYYKERLKSSTLENSSIIGIPQSFKNLKKK